MIYTLLALFSGAFVYIGHLFYNQRKHNQLLCEQLDSMQKALNDVMKDHPVLINADLFFSRQLREINAQLVSMDNQLQQLENKRDNDGGYQHALRILEMGGDRAEIVENCHLSNAEAELLMNLQAYRAAMKP